MEKIYNIVVVLKTDKDNLKKEDEIKKAIKKEADYLDDRSIGEQNLAYQIEGETEGYYFWIDFDAKPEQLSKIESKINEIEPLRFLITKKPKEALEKRKVEAEEEKTKSQDKKKVSGTKKTDSAPKKTEKKTKKKKESPEDEKKKIEDLDKKLEEIL
jgi:ribosomal protein S6